MKEDPALLAEYARDRSEAAFAELVRRHVNFVYAAALRQVNGDTHLAQDVTQTVFVDLARKAAKVSRHTVLAGWLFTSTRYAAAKSVRTEQRRRAREQEARTMQEMNHDAGEHAALDWARVRPVLDAALAELGEADRTAILLRYLQDRPFDEVGARLALSENAARMRTERALDKLRARLARRGIASTTTALALALAGQAAVAAPAGLAPLVTGTALAGAATGGGLLAFMSTAKLQWGITASVVAAGAGVGLVQEQSRQRLEAELAAVPAALTRTASVLRAENEKLAAANAAAEAQRVTDADWLRLRDEVVGLQEEIQEREAAERAALAEAGEQARRTALALNQLDQPPRAAIRRAPAYPAALREANIPGSVVVEFVIDRTGRVADARVVKSTHPDFEPPTLAALSEWRFTPGLKGGRQVNTRVTQAFQYEPNGAPSPEAPEWF
jgi:RNA polymerase sigma factor (sigma-70 family)